MFLFSMLKAGKGRPRIDLAWRCQTDFDFVTARKDG